MEFGLFHLVFEPVCLHPGMTTLGVIALDYCVAIYPIILIALTYFLVKLHDRFTPFQKLWKPLTHLLHYCNKEWKVSNFLIETFGTFCFYSCRCFQSCLNRCRLNSQVLRTFMDAFQGCYKFEPCDCRYWAAFYLFLRLAVLIIFA